MHTPEGIDIRKTCSSDFKITVNVSCAVPIFVKYGSTVKDFSNRNGLMRDKARANLSWTHFALDRNTDILWDGTVYRGQPNKKGDLMCHISSTEASSVVGRMFNPMVVRAICAYWHFPNDNVSGSKNRKYKRTKERTDEKKNGQKDNRTNERKGKKRIKGETYKGTNG